MKLSDESIKLLDELIANEVTYRITSIILTILLILVLVAFWLYAEIKDKKTKELRQEWFATLTEEQRKAIREEKKLKLK